MIPRTDSAADPTVDAVASQPRHATGLALPVPHDGPLKAVFVTLAIIALAVALSIAVALVGMRAGTGGADDAATLIVSAAVAQVVFGLGALGALALPRRRPGDQTDIGTRLGLVAPPRGIVDYAAAIGGLVGMATAIQAFRAFVLGHDVLADLWQLAPLFRTWLWPASFVIIVLLAPVAEELLFRGYLMPALARSPLGLAGAAVVSSALWTVLHVYSLPAMVLVFLMGLLLSWMFARTGSLRVPIVAHVANNLLAAASLLYLLRA